MTSAEDRSDTPRPATRVHLRIAATSDLHMNLLAYDYHADAPSPGIGLSRVASRIAEARVEVPGLVLLDNGDFLQGSPMGDYAAQAPQAEGRAHPMIAAMNALGYDAIGLGNHEFDYGLEFLQAALAEATCPVLSANAVGRCGETPLDDVRLPHTRPWAILDRQIADEQGVPQPLRLGILSLLPPQVIQWDRERLEGRMEVRCMIEAARAHVPVIRAAGADVVVALAHCGPSDRPEQTGMENALVPLAGIRGIDALVAGHLHRLLPGPQFAGVPGVEAEAGRVCGKPVVMPGIAGSHLGVVDLWLEGGPGAWRVTDTHAELRPIARRGTHGLEPLVADAPEVACAVAENHAATLAWIRRPVGRSEIALHSFTSFAAPCPVIHAINAAQRWYVRQTLPDTGLPVLSAAAPFKAGGPAGAENFTDIPAGPLRYSDLSALYPFPNSIRAIRVTGAQLHDWLERAAGAFNRLAPGVKDQPLLNPEFPSYDFDVISGLEWEIDLSQPVLWSHDGRARGAGAGRIRHLRFKGCPVEAGQEFIVATNSYRIAGSGLYAPLAEAEVVLAETTPSREVLTRLIASTGGLRGPVERCWRFAPMRGCEAVLETGPGALRHLDALAASGVRQLVPDGPGESGFQRLRLTL